MTRRVLVTGASGLIGRQVLAPLAAAGFEVIAVARHGTVPGAVATLNGDLLSARDRVAMLRDARAGSLMHLAWHDAPNGRWADPANLDWAAATISLVREFAETGGKRVVAAGSCAEYDWSYEMMGETTPLRPVTLYGQAKAATGTLLTGAADALGLSLAWARIFFCYGPGEPRGRLLGDLIHGIKAGEVVPCSDGKQERDYLHTADIGRALAMVLASDHHGPINIASGEALRVGDLIRRAAELAGAPDLVDLGARPRPDLDPSRLVGDVARLNGLGFQPEWDLTRGLKDCLRAALVEPV